MEVRPDPAPSQAPPGWYTDFWTSSRKRYWNGTAWTYATRDAADADASPPTGASPLPDGHKLPPPVAGRPAAAAGAGPEPKRQRPVLWIGAALVGLLVGLGGLALLNRSSSEREPASTAAPEPEGDPTPGATPSTTIPLPSAGNDPSAAALESLIVLPDDVPESLSVVVFPGGFGLDQPTLDVCNGRYPSESRRTARIQDAVLDADDALVLSTEAVLYADAAATTQAFAELRAVVGACPATPVPGPAGQPAITTRFNPPPDSGWPQTPSVDRLAYDLTSDDGSGPPRRSVAVYLRRGRVLLGVYFARPDGPQHPVEGQTTVEGIVGVFAARVAALPASVVGP